MNHNANITAGHISTQPGTRRAFLVGATAAGIAALAGANAPAASAADLPVKMLACIRKRPDLTLPEFYDYWLNKHAPLATKMCKQLGAVRYVQSHTSDRDLGLLLATSRGQVLQAFDGITEVWFPSRIDTGGHRSQRSPCPRRDELHRPAQLVVLHDHRAPDLRLRRHTELEAQDSPTARASSAARRSRTGPCGIQVHT